MGGSIPPYRTNLCFLGAPYKVSHPTRLQKRSRVETLARS